MGIHASSSATSKVGGEGWRCGECAVAAAAGRAKKQKRAKTADAARSNPSPDDPFGFSQRLIFFLLTTNLLALGQTTALFYPSSPGGRKNALLLPLPLMGEGRGEATEKNLT
jgi:hypothetical protein